MNLLTRQGHLIEEEGVTYLARTESIDPDNLPSPLQAASTTWRIAMGPRAGRKVLSIVGGGECSEPHRSLDVLCANTQGFSLRAGVCRAADDRQGIEQLCSYIPRPAISNERLNISRVSPALASPFVMAGAANVAVSCRHWSLPEQGIRYGWTARLNDCRKPKALRTPTI